MKCNSIKFTFIIVITFIIAFIIYKKREMYKKLYI